MYDHYRHHQKRDCFITTSKGAPLPSEAKPEDWELVDLDLPPIITKQIAATGYAVYKLVDLTRDEINELKR